MSTFRPGPKVNRGIPAFLAQNCVRNDTSSRCEPSLLEKRKRLQKDEDFPEDGIINSCARTDARSIDRNAQVKYETSASDQGQRKDIQQWTKEDPSTVAARPEGPIVMPRARRHFLDTILVWMNDCQTLRLAWQLDTVRVASYPLLSHWQRQKPEA